MLDHEQTLDLGRVEARVLQVMPDALLAVPDAFVEGADPQTVVSAEAVGLRRGEEGSGGQRLGARLGHPPLADAPQQHSVQRDGPELGKPARVDGFEHAPKAIAGEGP